MKTIVVLLLIAATASAIEWTDLRVTWSASGTDPLHLTSFYQMPRTKSDAINNSWVEVSGLTSLNLTVYCLEGDGHVCLEYDSYGNIAAMQVSILYDDVANMQSIYNMSAFNQYQIKTIFNELYWTATIYFISPDAIAAGGRRETNGLTGTEGIWIGTTNGYTEMLRNVSDWDSVWSEENCIDAMGTHYFYDLNSSTECADIQPWFWLVQDDELSGIGLLAFGNATYTFRSYHEDVSGLAEMVDDAPECAVDWIDEYGAITMHIYFTPKPWEYEC